MIQQINDPFLVVILFLHIYPKRDNYRVGMADIECFSIFRMYLYMFFFITAVKATFGTCWNPLNRPQVLDWMFYLLLAKLVWLACSQVI